MPSSFVGCQSIGAMRSSNFFEAPSFHLRKTVQRMATPPTDAATTMSTVVIVLFFWAAADCGGGTVLLLLVSAAARTDVLVTVDWEWDAGVSAASASGVCGAGVVWDAGGGALVCEAAADTELAEADADAEALADALADALTETAEAELDAESDGSALAEADWAEADTDPDRATAEAEDPALGSVGVLGMVGSLGFWATLINPNCGERFLIKRLRLSWSRRWGWAKS
jgi:hypothetical protein